MNYKNFQFGKGNIKLIFSIAIALLPFLYLYKVPIPGLKSIMGLGEFILLVCMVLLSSRVKFIIYDKWFALLCIYSIIISLVDAFYPWFSLNDSLAGVARVLFYFFSCMYAVQFVDKDILIRVYKIAVLVFSIYLLMQVFTYFVFGIKLTSYFNINWMFEPPGRNETYITWMFRGRSLFNEPSYYALYSGPFFIVGFLKKKLVISDYLQLAIVTSAMLLSTSSAGFLLVIIGWWGILYFKYLQKGRKVSKYLLLVLLFIFVAAIIFFANNPIFKSMITRTISGASVTARVFRSFIVYRSLNFIHFFTGIGLNQDTAYQQYYDIHTIYDESTFHTLQSSIVAIPCMLGLIGGVIFIIWLIDMIRKNRSKETLYLVIMFLVTCCIEKTMFMYRMGFYLCFIYVLNKYEGEMNNMSET